VRTAQTYPDKPAPAAYRLEREIAAGHRVSKDFVTYTFTLRRGFRFSDGRPVRASAFAHAINRALQPFVNAAGAIHMRDIVGDVRRAASSPGETRSSCASRDLHLTSWRERPCRSSAPSRRTSRPPPRESVRSRRLGPLRAGVPSGERVVIRRNRFYGGSRKVHLDGFDVDLQGGTPQDMLRRIDRDEADWGHALSPPVVDPTLGLLAKYGVNRSEL